MCTTVSAETREERKLRIERKYLFEQQEVVQLNLELPDDPDEDPLGRDPGFKASSNESLAAGSGMVRRPSGAPVRRATGFEETEEEYGLFGETSDSDMTAADLRRQKLDDNWQRLMDAQRTRSTERSPSSAYGLSPYSSGASSGSAYSSGYSSFSQPQPASPSALGSLNSLGSPMSGTTAGAPGATRTTTPGLSPSSSSAWSTSSGSSSAPSSVSPIRSTTPRTTTTPSLTPSTGSGFRGTDGASLLDI